MIRRPSPKRPRTRPTAKKAAIRPRSYHHGDLRRVLIDAALRLAEERGVDAVRVREAARLAGVSPGAPFRHFPTRAALIMAVAEEAQRRFRVEIADALEAAPKDDPLARFRALGIAYVRWALRNPTHFEVISTGSLFDHRASQELTRDNDEVIGWTERLLADAFERGQLRSGDLHLIKVAGRALVYGFARMNIDGHFPRWGVTEAEAERTAEAVIDFFIGGIAKDRQA